MQAREKGISFNVPLLSVSPLIIADKDTIHQVFINLLDNAFRYTSKDQSIDVYTQIEPESKGITFYVQDSGIRISPVHLQHIWDKFYKAYEARTRTNTGSGIGLAIVKHIVETHGGRVSVESTPHRGSVFIFILPY